MKPANTKLNLKAVPAIKDCKGCFFKSSGKHKCMKSFTVGYAGENCVSPKSIIFVEA